MTERWVGLVISGEKVTVADAEVPDDGPLILQADLTWKLQTGSKPAAYYALSQLCSNYLRENGIEKVVIKASATSQSGVRLGHFHSAELRGVIQSAAASVCEVKVIPKAAVSKNFGDRKVDEYIKDTGFWGQEFNGKPLRSGSREAAMLLLAERKQA
ncbi:MAG: hypothetical protein HOL07_14165 [Rhodospirillaceae bacterium]|mgnify:CR=1|nr:hypothetical protein [Rhodospirillaceae bacterium]MBT3807964.1 hypothetical protein [Rhodospirillaceae bacterium]MBT3930466.1 hypothetical protein [Rhodospirillaceae bacterium]MBT4772196.1 hypothetical protein [Rhodospirillaceae bacterium]MBT5359483.1 hypothetical protein [Rhodospirillaceae bacterium]